MIFTVEYVLRLAVAPEQAGLIGVWDSTFDNIGLEDVYFYAAPGLGGADYQGLVVEGVEFLHSDPTFPSDALARVHAVGVGSDSHVVGDVTVEGGATWGLYFDCTGSEVVGEGAASLIDISGTDGGIYVSDCGLFLRETNVHDVGLLGGLQAVGGTVGMMDWTFQGAEGNGINLSEGTGGWVMSGTNGSINNEGYGISCSGGGISFDATGLDLTGNTLGPVQELDGCILTGLP